MGLRENYGRQINCHLLFSFLRERPIVLKRRKLPKPDHLIVSTEQGLAATKTTSSRWPVGGEMFFLTASFRGRWMTFQDESAVREQSTSQVVKKRPKNSKSIYPFGLILSNLNFVGFSAFYQLDVLMCDGKAGKCFLFVNRVVAAAIFKVCGRWRHGSALSTRVCKR